MCCSGKKQIAEICIEAANKWQSPSSKLQQLAPLSLTVTPAHLSLPLSFVENACTDLPLCSNSSLSLLDACVRMQCCCRGCRAAWGGSHPECGQLVTSEAACGPAGTCLLPAPPPHPSLCPQSNPTPSPLHFSCFTPVFLLSLGACANCCLLAFPHHTLLGGLQCYCCTQTFANSVLNAALRVALVHFDQSNGWLTNSVLPSEVMYLDKSKSCPCSRYSPMSSIPCCAISRYPIASHCMLVLTQALQLHSIFQCLKDCPEAINQGRHPQVCGFVGCITAALE